MTQPIRSDRMGLRYTLFPQNPTAQGGLQATSGRECLRVRREFPHVCLETCASGGGRNDLGMLSRCHYAARDRSRSCAGVFRLQSTHADEATAYIFRPRGIAAGRRYRVTLDNNGYVFHADGADLLRHGIPLPPGPAGASELLLFEEQGDDHHNTLI